MGLQELPKITFHRQPQDLHISPAILPCSAAWADEAADRQWSVGYAEVEITPGVGRVQMSGFGRERYAKGALAPLLTQTVVLRDRDGRMGVLIGEARLI